MARVLHAMLSYHEVWSLSSGAIPWYCLPSFLRTHVVHAHWFPRYGNEKASLER